MESRIVYENKPSMEVFVVHEQDGESFWRRIGAAFDHRDGKGKTIIVDAWPVGDRLMLREVATSEAVREIN